jgi:hypothetical protein
MGGNVDGSVARYWVLKGQLRAGSPSVPGSSLVAIPSALLLGAGSGGGCRGSGFGGVFVNWIVDASI